MDKYIKVQQLLDFKLNQNKKNSKIELLCPTNGDYPYFIYTL